jgi:hypothetical protein
VTKLNEKPAYAIRAVLIDRFGLNQPDYIDRLKDGDLISSQSTQTQPEVLGCRTKNPYMRGLRSENDKSFALFGSALDLSQECLPFDQDRLVEYVVA